MRKTLLVGCSVVAFSHAPIQAQSQPANAEADAATGIADIVVTANRRAESVQRSSLAIQAFDEESLRKSGVTQATDLNKLAPSLQLGYSGVNTQIYVRGVGDTSANPLSNPGVSFNIDGVYVGRPQAVGSSFYDIARIEVLKGPQGTLYGRNSSGGAINLITNDPVLGKLSGNLNAEIGNYDLYHLDGAINLPLGQTAALRVALNRVLRDGYLSDDTSDDDQFGARVKLLWEPSDTARLLLSGDYEKIGGRGGGFVYRPRRAGASAWEGTTDPRAAAYARTYNPAVISAPTALTQFRPPSIDGKFYNVSAQLDLDLDFAKLTILPAYRHVKTDAVSYRAFYQRQIDKADQFTGEVRLGNATPALKWVIGAYYFHEKNPGQLHILTGPALFESNPVYNPKGNAYAAFGEATVSLTDQFRVIAGARYTKEKRTLTGQLSLAIPAGTGNFDTKAGFIPIENFAGRANFNAFTWRAGVEFDLAPQSLMFFTASKGFKSGGLTQTVAPLNVYRPEKVLAFELGSKNRFFDNRLQLNLEAFHWTYKDQQTARLTFDPLGNLNFLNQNAGKARLYGANMEIVARPTSQDELRFNAEYLNTKYKKFDFTLPIFAYNPASNGCAFRGAVPGPFVPLASLDCAGFSLPHAPKWSFQGEYTHTFELAGGGVIEPSIGYRHATANWVSVDFVPTARAPKFTKINASITYRSDDDAMSITAYVRNINNGKEVVGSQIDSFTAPLTTTVITAPRTYGVTTSFRF
jgi:iron complex outermembrane receptor protein